MFSQPTLTVGAAPAIRAYLTRLSDTHQRAFIRRRPWFELVDPVSLSRPVSFSEATSRVRKNLSYFRVNYLAVVASSIAISLLSHPFSLLTLLSLLAAWLSLYSLRPSDQPVVLLGRTYSDRETLGGLVAITTFVIFLTSIGSLLMSSALVGLGIICVHGAFRVPEGLFLDDKESAGSGIFSIFAGVAAAPDAASRV